MANVVGYMEDWLPADSDGRRASAFSEGPFVIVQANGWRIECDVPEKECPALLDMSVYDLLRKSVFGIGKWGDKETAELACDWLNKLVKEGKIKLIDQKFWEAV